jgi:CTP synthase
MRLGSYDCIVRPGSLAESVYGSLQVTERHRHRFEFDPSYREQMEQSGFIVSATSPDGTLAEVVEIQDHPYMIATQAHPELISRPHRPHPLFVGFVKAMI